MRESPALAVITQLLEMGARVRATDPYVVPVSSPKVAELTKLLENTFRHVNIALVNELAEDINDHMPDYVVRRIIKLLNRDQLAVNGSTILLLGLAYKRNTGDARESPALVIAQRLLEMGADVRAADPHVTEDGIDPRVARVSCTPEEVASADLVVVVTDHDDFDFEMITNKARRILETRRRLNTENTETL